MPGLRRPVFPLAAVLLSVCAPAAEAPLVPYTVCEILRDPAMYEGKPIAALGRYSYRQDGRWLSEQACQDAAAMPPVIWLTEDTKDGPKAPNNFELDGVVMSRKLADLRKRTALGKFRFGSSDYDRWAVVYGRVESRKGDAAKKAPAGLVFRGDGVVIFLTPDQ
jgi:hypothetical protein